MPTKSLFPDVIIPNVDLWDFMFEQEREEAFPHDSVIYRSLRAGRQYTYDTVKTAAAAFGNALVQQWDWKTGDILSIFSANDIDVAPCIYGVLFAGGIVSPANPGYSAEEFSFMLKDAGVKAIATQRAFLPIVLQAAELSGITQDRIVLLGDDEHDVKSRNSSRGQQQTLKNHFQTFDKMSGNDLPKNLGNSRRKAANPDKDLAFLVYSSGTTGLPKGVMLSHTNIISDVLMIKSSMGKYYNYKDDKILSVLPFFHIYGLTGLVHQPLHRGIETIVMPSFNLGTFCRTIQDHKISFVYVAPPVIVHLARNPLVDQFDLSSLRMITSGAAPLTRELVDRVHSRLKLKINQAYGLSETSPMTHVQPWEDWYTSVGSVGRMFSNMTAKYMSADGKELGAGGVGELWLKGPNVFKGYWKRPEATQEAISEDGYFKTGDVGYQDEHHNFYITDRVKELIKYKGFQVAPAELEGLLLGNSEVDDVAVIGVDLPDEHTEGPRAYIVVAPGVERNEDTARRITQWLDGKVAWYKKLRGGVCFIDEIPKSASGKILRRILKEKIKASENEGTRLKSKL